jgi:hypothetical protein
MFVWGGGPTHFWTENSRRRDSSRLIDWNSWFLTQNSIERCLGNFDFTR